MSSDKTIATELGICFGILGIPVEERQRENMLRIQNVTDNYLNRMFTYYRSSDSNARLVDRMWQIGRELFPAVQGRIIVSPETTEWTGPVRQSATTIVGRDLVFNGIQSVSVKAKSNVISNRAPRVLIEDLPSGSGSTSRGRHWYCEVAPDEYQRFYSAFNPTSFNLPESVDDYDTVGRWPRRREFMEYVRAEFRNNPRYQQLYSELCERVTNESARRFTENMQVLLNTSGSSPMLRSFCEHFFRINSTAYILAGIDGSLSGGRGNNNFAVEIPSATNWNTRYNIHRINAEAASGRGQPIVFIDITLRDRETSVLHTFSFRLEIRWSHGKFCGAPEGKLYKDFLYVDLPWVTVFVNEQPGEQEE